MDLPAGGASQIYVCHVLNAETVSICNPNNVRLPAGVRCSAPPADLKCAAQSGVYVCASAAAQPHLNIDDISLSSRLALAVAAQAKPAPGGPSPAPTPGAPPPSPAPRQPYTAGNCVAHPGRGISNHTVQSAPWVDQTHCEQLCQRTPSCHAFVRSEGACKLKGVCALDGGGASLADKTAYMCPALCARGAASPPACAAQRPPPNNPPQDHQTRAQSGGWSCMSTPGAQQVCTRNTGR